MKSIYTNCRNVGTSFLSILLVLSLGCQGGEQRNPNVSVDLAQIKERGKLTAITGYSAISYFIYRGQPMGFEYEILSQVADSMDLDFDIVLAHDLEEMFTMLNDGVGDLIAFNLTVTKQRQEKVAFSEHHTLTRQVLVQRKPDNWRQMKLHEIERFLIRDPVDLIGDSVHVRKGSAYISRLQNLSEEIGGDIQIVEAPVGVTSEDLIRMVANKKIDYAIADQNVAKISQSNYANIDVETPVSLSQRIAWAVRKNSPELLADINETLRKLKSGALYNILYNKYYKNRYAFKKRMKSEFLFVGKGSISPYDSLLQMHADSLGWDWRLLASQVYQESQFDPTTKSWMGAIGLMQVLPRTGKMFGVTNLYDPAENIKAGIGFLLWLDNYWQEKIVDPNERQRIILASYNVGQGHVEDARKLAVKYGRDPNVWKNNVEYYLEKKSLPEYFNDETVEFGYCRGSEPVNYVREILERYQNYIDLSPPDMVSNSTKLETSN